MSLADYIEDELPFYDHETRQMSGSQTRKAEEFLKRDLVRKVQDGCWKVLPIPGYNKRTYSINLVNNQLVCNCQYNATKGKFCSHMLAVLKLERLGK